MSFHKGSVLVIITVCLLALLVVPVSAEVQTFYDVNDGYVNQLANSSWPVMRNAAGDNVANDNANYIVADLTAADTEGNYTSNKRGLVTFNTSGITTINSAVITFWAQGKGNGVGAFNYSIVNTSAIEVGGNFAATDYGKTDFSRLSYNVEYSDITAFQMVNFTLTAAGIDYINRTGNTTFMITSGCDIDNCTPAWANAGDSYLFLYSKQKTSGLYTPFLTLNADPPTGLTYYAYGDSITRATGGTLNPDGSDAYVIQMNKTHNATATADHNADGGSKTSGWGLVNYADHGDSADNIFIMFGANDRALGETGTATAQNLSWLYSNYTAAGFNSYILLEPLAAETADEWTTYENQYDNITIIKNFLFTDGVPNSSVVDMYDAIDSVPRNSIPDESNASLKIDYIHPNAEGHRLMGEYLWDYVLNDPPTASFTANVTSGLVPLAVGFTDTSTNTPTDWDWYIDNVKFSDLQNPEYTFTEAGVYDVSLYAANGASGDWENKSALITVTNWYDLQCQNQTGNISINLFFNSTTSLGWQWSDPGNITKIAEDGLYVLSFDNSSDYFIGTGYSPESWHKLKIYNETDFGQLNCTTDAVPITPTPIPIMPSTESNVNPVNLFSYWPYALLVLGLVVVFKKW